MRLPVGAVGASAVTAAAVSALAVLTSGQQVGGRFEGLLPGLEVVAEVRVWESPVEAVQEANSYLRVGDLVAMHGVGAPQVIEGIHVDGDGAVRPYRIWKSKFTSIKNHHNICKVERSISVVFFKL